MDQITKINLDYYQQLYRYKNPILHLLHSRLSFDQQSKSRINHTVIDPIIIRIAKERANIKILDYGSGWGVFLLNLPNDSADAYCYDIAPNAVKSLQSVMQFCGRKIKEINFTEDNRICPYNFDSSKMHFLLF